MQSRAIGVVGIIALCLTLATAQRPQLVWSDLYNDASIVYNTDASSTLLDEAGNLYLVNAPYQSVNFLRSGKLSRYTPKIIVEQYAPSGALNWRLEWRHPQAMSHNLLGSALDAQGRLTLFVHVVRSVWRSDLNRVVRVSVAPGGIVERVQTYSVNFIEARGFAHQGGSGEVFLFLAGRNASSPSQLWKFSPSGELLWRSPVGLEVDVLSTLPTGEIVAAGRLGTLTSVRTVAKLTADGSVIWSTRTTTTSSSPAYYAVGTGADGAVYAVNSSGNVEVFDANGTLVYTETSLRPQNYLIGDALVLPDGVLLLWVPRSLSASGVILMRTNSELTPIWQVDQLGEAFSTTLSRSGRFLQLSDDSILVVVAESLNNRLTLSRISPAGERLWQRRIAIPSQQFAPRIAVLRSTNNLLFLAMVRSGVINGFAFNTEGEPLFQTTMQHQQSAYDLVYQLLVDDAGNPALTRYSLDQNYFTYGLSYSSTGVRRWNLPAAGYALYDSIGNWISYGWYWQQTGASRVLKRAPDGGLLWNYTYANLGNIVDAAADGDNSIYVATFSVESRFVHQLDANGSLRWSHPLSDAPIALISALAGGVFVLQSNLYVLRLSADGALMWGTDEPLAMYICRSSGSDTLYLLDRPGLTQWRLTRLNPDGSYAWQRLYDLQSRAHFSLILADEQSVYVGHQDQERNRLSVLCFRARTGTPVWEQSFDWIIAQPQTAIDNAGNLYLAFRRYDGESQAAYALKIAPSGEQLWAMEYTPRADAPLQLMGLAVDPQNRVLLTGEVIGDAGDSDIFIAQFRQPILGDANGDGCVDDADLLAVLFGFDEGDLNGDGAIDDADLLRVLFRFGAGC